MPAPDQSRQKKCVKACKRCRSMKVKCSGSQPCVRCARRKKDCQFPKDETRVSVSERYLRELEESLARSSTGHEQSETIEDPPVQDGDVEFSSDDGPSSLSPGRHPEQWQMRARGIDLDQDLPALHQESRTGNYQRCHSDDHGSQFAQNPLVDKDCSFALTSDGRSWYMGPTSSWSFCRRVLGLIGRQVPPSSSPPDQLHLDGAAFRLKWKTVSPDEVPDVSNLPPFDNALFLFNTVKFYFGFLSHMIDEAAFLGELNEFYEDPEAKAASSRVWYSQYLLIIAFGKAFLVNKDSNGFPAGYQYASRAMSVLPGLSGLEPNPLTCIQTLSLAAVYFQCIDMKMAAYHHIGQALRTCIIEGIHRHVPEGLGGLELSRKCRNIFWVVYMLDREFSARIGAPTSIRDEDITVKLPAELGSSMDDINLTLHVRLARLMAQILTTVYGADEKHRGALICNTQAILHNLAELSQDLDSFLGAHFDGPIGRASKMAVQLMLSYHYCVVLTTRPLVMCALHMHIAESERQTYQIIPLSTPVASLLQCCANSAQTLLQILRNLAIEDELMEVFLPFQVEYASSSAFVLYLIRAIAPSLISHDLWCENLDCILDKYISRGNPAVPLRKRELQELEHLLRPLSPGSSSSAIPNVIAEQDPSMQNDSYTMDSSVRLEDDELQWQNTALNYSLTIAPRELLELADQLDVDNLLQSAES